MKYELCYLIGESREQDFSKIKEEVSAIVSKEGGKWLEPQIEEKRKMAYKVGKEVRGVYVAQQFEVIKDEESERNNPLDNINKKLNLYNDVLRFIIVKAEDVPELKVREGKPIFAKDSGNGRGGYKKPVYVKKEAVTKEKAEEKKSVGAKVMADEKEEIAPEAKEEKIESTDAKAVIDKEKTEDKKSIDEKIDEILNI